MSIIAVKGLKPLSFTIIDLDNGKNMVVTAKGEEAERKEGTRKTVVFILLFHSFNLFAWSFEINSSIDQESNRMTGIVSVVEHEGYNYQCIRIPMRRRKEVSIQQLRM